jgi:chromate reductase, NAD(P)H dehydrogenase (quinone)
MKNILGISGSLRMGASSTAVLRAVMGCLPQETEMAVAEIGTLPHYNADHDGGPEVARLIGQIQQADGVIFVSPEYNYSIPGVLKNAIDWASRPAYASVFKGKPCMVITVSAGALGGVRAQGHLKYILNGMLADVHSGQEIVIPHAPKRLIDGQFSDADTLGFISSQLNVFLDRA